MNIKASIGIAVFTLNAQSHLARCLSPFLNSPLAPRLLVVDSSSDDATISLAQKMGAETLVIPRQDFNHGATREMARHHLNTDIVVMLTQDAYAVDETVLAKLIAPIEKGEASVSYARQIPHEGADLFEAFPRHFNYPEKSQLRSIEDLATYGVYTFFCSNSCAAYLNSALNSIGGFKPVTFGEDTLAAAELLEQGCKIAYVAEAKVHHSHRYSLFGEFQRHYQIGKSRQRLAPLISRAGSDEQRGRLYLQQLTKLLAEQQPLYLPYAYLQTAIKWLGYRLGTITITKCRSR
jgi:rhamnosyltransferase